REAAMLLGDRRPQPLLELPGVDLAHAFVLARDDDVDPVRPVADVLVDPAAFDLELIGRKPDRSEHPQAAGAADGRDHVATVAEREDGKRDAQARADLGAHGGYSSSPAGVAGVSSCKPQGYMASTSHGRRGRARLRSRATSSRLTANERRRDLLRVAASLMTRHGVDGVQMAEVATTGGVSRPLVYRFFPSPPALLRGVLEAFAAAPPREFGRHAMDRLPADVEEATRVYVDAVCDTIESKGVGPWHLLDSKGPDREIARLGQEIMRRLTFPWHARISRVTGSGE